MAMMPSGSGSGNPSHYDPYDNDADLIDPDDGTTFAFNLSPFLPSLSLGSRIDRMHFPPT